MAYQHFKIIFTVWWRLPKVAKPHAVEVRSHAWFGNEVSSTPKLISSLERATYSLFFGTNIKRACFVFILSSKRSISIEIERGKNLESFGTSRLNSTGTFSRSEIAHIVWWMHGRAVHKDIYHGSSLGNR